MGVTNEEAIDFGNMWLEINEDCKDSSTYEFFQMAVKALEQKPNVEKVIRCHDVTPEEQKSVNGYIKTISNPTEDYYKVESEKVRIDKNE